MTTCIAPLPTMARDTHAPEPLMSISPVIHPCDGIRDPRSRTFWSATANALYIVRRQADDLFGPIPDLSDRLAQGNDLVNHGRRGPIGCDADGVLDLALWQAADQAALTDRPSAPVAYHLIGRLPSTLTREAWREIVLEYLDRAIVVNGMVADWAIHALVDREGRWIKRPHVHIIVTHRFWRAGRRTGEPNHAWCGSPKLRTKLMDTWSALVGSDDAPVGAASLRSVPTA
jgi:hypothetical protein